MQTQVAPQIELAKIVLANLAEELLAGVEQGNSLQDKLAQAHAAEREVASALDVIVPALAAARAAVVERAVALRAEVRAAAVAEVVTMLDEGAITLGRLATLAGAKVVDEGNMTFERVAPVAAPAPMISAVVLAPVVAAIPAPVIVDARGAKLAPEVRENLRLQAAYRNPVKFRDPTTGAGWSGRGPMPKWLKELLVDGKSVEAFRVGAEAPATAAEPVASAEAPAAAVVADEVGPLTVPSSDSGDIGEEVVSFDAFGLDGDLNTPDAGDDIDGDIGEILDGIAAMGLGGAPAGNTASFLVAA